MRHFQEHQQVIIATFRAQHVELNGLKRRPFFLARLSCTEAARLSQSLEKLSRTQTRSWFFLTSSTPDPLRLRLLDLQRTPAYELSASRHYIRGQILAVTGKTASCNLNFSVEGAMLINSRLRAAVNEARDYVEIQVPNRRRELNLVEFLSDTELEARSDGTRLAAAAEQAISEVWPAEDFSDWEEPA